MTSSAPNPILSRGAVRRPRGDRAFTLTELMIAVVVLIGILLATSKIFSTTSKVTSAGRAATDVLREAAAIERQLRADIAGLSPEGFFAIRNVGVPNDVRIPLLNPNLPPDAIIRADQLVFFANGVESPVTNAIGGGQDRKAQGQVTRMYYGHAFQLGDGGRAVEGPFLKTHDPLDRVYPWSAGNINMVRTKFKARDPGAIDDDVYTWGTPTMTPLAPVDARQWLFVRQPVVLVDDDQEALDDNSKTRYLYNITRPGGVATGRSIFLTDPRPVLGWTPQVFHGRVDAAATQMNELRQVIQYDSAGALRLWWDGTQDDMRSLIAQELIYYPRAERKAPSMNRVDQALTSAVIGNGCSSIRIDWTYADGAGEVRDALGNIVTLSSGIPIGRGFDLDPDFDPSEGIGQIEQPWFGLRDDEQGVAPYGDVSGEPSHQVEAGYEFADTIQPKGEVPNTIETVYFLAGTPISAYEAIFGFNQETAFRNNPVTGTLEPHEDLGFTPWPTAIRVTLTLHDADTKLEGGREVQFVIDLPKRFAGLPR